MKAKHNLLLFSVIVALLLVNLAVAGYAQEPVPQAGIGTAFTYQGQLVRNNGPANGSFEFQFKLYDAAASGTQVGSSISQTISVNDGLFNTDLDFGDGIFTGAARYLQISVRPASSGASYTTLSPRQTLTPAPYALYAPQAGAVDWSGVTNVPADIADGDDVGGAGIQSVAAGDGLSGGGSDAAITLTVAYSGSGVLNSAARSDHHHDVAYAPLSHTHSITAPQTFKHFEEALAITTTGASDWEFFTIDDQSYLALSNNNKNSNFNIDSKIYLWDGETLSETQAISTTGAMDWEFFTISNTAYLAVANYFNGSSYNNISKLYRWDGNSFSETQTFATSGAPDWESFTISDTTYLAVANHYNDSSHNINSIIYRWNGSQFDHFQSIPTSGAFDWEFFTIDEQAYLVVANHFNGSSYSVNSILYRWNGTNFITSQAIPTSGAYDWEFFTIGEQAYLVVANHRNASTHNVDSQIYRWDGARFNLFQAIRTNGAWDWESFTINEQTYLVVANSLNDYSYNISSRIYRWDEISFAEVQAIPTYNTRNWEAFTSAGETYLAVANVFDGHNYTLSSKIYKATMESLADTLYLQDASGKQLTADYVQLEILNAAPPTSDCDETAELGRMKVDVDNDVLYICTNSGWVSK